MRYGKLQFDVIKEWLKYEDKDVGKRELKVCNNYFYNGIYYKPIMYKTHYVYLIPEGYFTLSDKVVFPCHIDQVLDEALQYNTVATYSIDNENMHIYLYSEDHTVIIDRRALKYFEDLEDLSFYIKDGISPVYIEEQGCPRAIILPIRTKESK